MKPRIELIVVPYEVERDDTPMARGPEGLLARGFGEALAADGCDVREERVRAEAAPDRAAVVASAARETARAVAAARREGRFPLVLAGGCLAAVGVTGALRLEGLDVGIVWCDAHGDFNTPKTSPSGYWEGMALAAACGLGLEDVYGDLGFPPVAVGRIAHLGGRNLDPPEVEAFARLGVLLLPPRVLADPAAAAGRIAERLAGADALYLHLDLDALDPADAPAVGFPEPGGIRLDDLVECLARLGPPTAFTLSALRFDGVDEAAAQRMAAACVRLAGRALRAATQRGGGGVVKPEGSRAKLTYEDFLLFPDDGKRHEIIDGEHFVTPSPVTKHQRISMNLSRILASFLAEHPLGEVFAAPLDVVLSETDIVEPDLLFVSRERSQILTDKHLRGAPDLVIEIGSEGTRRTDEVIKRKLYEKYGVREYWVVVPTLETVKVYRLGAAGFERAAELSLESGDTLTTPLLPGLQLSLRAVFP